MLERPSPPRVLGILSIVFGAIGAAFSLFGLVAGATGMFNGAAGEAGRVAAERYAASLQPTSAIICVVMLAMSVALIVLGVGQRAYRRWAGRGSVTWGLVGLAVLAGQVFFHVLVVAPAFDRMLADLGLAHQAMAGMGKALPLVSLLFYAPYPIVLIAFFRKPVIAESMTE